MDQPYSKKAKGNCHLQSSPLLEPAREKKARKEKKTKKKQQLTTTTTTTTGEGQPTRNNNWRRLTEQELRQARVVEFINYN